MCSTWAEKARASGHILRPLTLGVSNKTPELPRNLQVCIILHLSRFDQKESCVKVYSSLYSTLVQYYTEWCLTLHNSMLKEITLKCCRECCIARKFPSLISNWYIEPFLGFCLVFMNLKEQVLIRDSYFGSSGHEACAELLIIVHCSEAQMVFNLKPELKILWHCPAKESVESIILYGSQV